MEKAVFILLNVGFAAQPIPIFFNIKEIDAILSQELRYLFLMQIVRIDRG